MAKTERAKRIDALARKARLRVRSGRRANNANTGRTKRVYAFARWQGWHGTGKARLRVCSGRNGTSEARLRLRSADALARPTRDDQSAYTRSIEPTRPHNGGQYGNYLSRGPE